ncbi:hypothetical protein HK101_005414 [Irineochytrium annulatum]|nr:hypothetical protein HK101_005414 [Irineochytrium annulatum]
MPPLAFISAAVAALGLLVATAPSRASASPSVRRRSYPAGLNPSIVLSHNGDPFDLAPSLHSSSLPQDTDLFGNTLPWDTTRWEALDDQIRGGLSRSNLSHIDPSDPSAGVLFSGYLDTTALPSRGGFASMLANLTFPASLLPSKQHGIGAAGTPHAGGLLLHLLPGSDSKVYTLNLRTARSGETGGVEWKCLFHPGPASAAAEHEDELLSLVPGKRRAVGGGMVVRCPWEEFVPYTKGRIVGGGEEVLDLGEVNGVSIMVQSLFDRQRGEFGLRIGSIAVTSSWI